MRSQIIPNQQNYISSEVKQMLAKEKKQITTVKIFFLIAAIAFFRQNFLDLYY